MTRIRSLIVAVAATTAVGVAYTMQNALHLEPCTLCIVVRYAFLLVAVLALWDVFFPFVALRALYSTVALVGAAVSSRHLWLLDHPAVSCGRDKLADWLNSLPTVSIWPSMFEATGLCGDKVPPLLGLSFPLWGLIGFLAVLAVAWLTTWSADAAGDLLEAAIDLAD